MLGKRVVQVIYETKSKDCTLTLNTDKIQNFSNNFFADVVEAKRINALR